MIEVFISSLSAFEAISLLTALSSVAGAAAARAWATPVGQSWWIKSALSFAFWAILQTGSLWLAFAMGFLA